MSWMPKSRPARGAWVEIANSFGLETRMDGVAPRKGRVG